jgi:chemotaxis response regulator CheB
MPIKVLLADDTELIRRAIRRILVSRPEIELVGEAIDFAQALQMKDQLQPEVIIMDLYVPNENNVPVEKIKTELLFLWF